MPRRPTATLIRWAAGGCLLAAGAVAAALTWPWTAGAAAKHLASAGFSDHNGVIVFEQQPSGTLGSARPDGSGLKTAGQLGSLQGNDVPVASPDGHYLATNEAQVVTLGPSGPASIAFTPMANQLQQDFGNWLDISFADGGKFLVAAECGGNVGAQWRVRITPVSASGTGSLLGTVNGTSDDSGVAGDPRSEGAFVVPGFGECGVNTQQAAPRQGDSGVLFEQPGRAPRTVITAAAVKQALGIAAATPVLLNVYPSPDGSELAVTASSFRIQVSQYGPNVIPTGLGVLVLTRTGQVVSKLGQPAGFGLYWSPDGKRIATPVRGEHASSWTIQIWPLSGRPATIAVPGLRDDFITRLLWSPDGTQLACGLENGRATSESQLAVHGWTIVNVRTGQAHNVTAPGEPAAWLSR